MVPHLAEKLMSGLLFVLFAGALVSAILSTVDSLLLASAAQVSHNIVMRLRPEASERVKLLSARLAVVAMAAVACVLALTACSIRDLVEVASAAGSPGLIVCLLFGLCSQFGGPVAAAAAILAGTAVWLAGLCHRVHRNAVFSRACGRSRRLPAGRTRRGAGASVLTARPAKPKACDRCSPRHFGRVRGRCNFSPSMEPERADPVF